jgi:uncharacterized protein (TIGR00297 family)
MGQIASPLFIGFVLASVIAVPAWRLRALDLSGAIAATIVGAIIFGLGGLHASAILITFFVTGSVLSGLPGGGRVLTGDEKQGRSWKQVVANGAIPAAAILFSLVPRLQLVAAHAFVGSVVAATADSWSTELGTRYGGRPQDALTGHTVTRGISGGISGIGLLASLAGAALIAGVSILPLSGLHVSAEPITFVAILIGGIVGMLADSALGSGVQAKYRCPACGASTETRDHCGQRGILVMGYKKMTNNIVNFAASAISAIILIVLLDWRA